MKAGNLPRIIFLTSTNLASNPRCRKEVELALEEGYEVVVFAFDMANWTRKEEEKIRKQWPKMEYHSLQATRTPWLAWLLTSLAQKASRRLYNIGWRSLLMSAITTDKRTITLLRAVKKLKPRGNLIVAHNPGAFYPAWWFSRKTGIPFAIDVEDYHPGESNGPLVHNSVLQLMRHTLPQAHYVSFAAPLIRETTEAVLEKKIQRALVINNVFPARDFENNNGNTTQQGPLKLVWFSQYIGFGRGLEEVLPVLEPFANRLQLTLIGNTDENFRATVLQQYPFITIKGAMSQESLNHELGNHDIGLAIESNRSDENRQICLTNKIWAFLQAGIYIWATGTPAQIRFANQFPDHTAVIDLENKEAISAFISKALGEADQLRSRKVSRQAINKTVSWETERNRLAQVWKTIPGL